MERKSSLSLLTVAFSAASGYTTPAVGDYVELGTVAWTVQAATSKSLKTIGRISNIDDTQTKNLVVETPYTYLTEVTAAAAIAIGDGLVADGSNKFVKYDATTPSPAHTPDMRLGICLETATTDGDSVHALML